VFEGVDLSETICEHILLSLCNLPLCKIAGPLQPAVTQTLLQNSLLYLADDLFLLLCSLQALCLRALIYQRQFGRMPS
jgi:hypothetical protein